MGIVRYPNFFTQINEHGLFGSHALVSRFGKRSSRTWYEAISAPMIARGVAYRRTALSRRTAATTSITERGYMAIRWYQHSRHGVKWATSDRYRLPRVEVTAIAAAPARARGPTAETTTDRRRPTATMPPTTITWVDSASKARNRTTASRVTGHASRFHCVEGPMSIV